MRNDDRELFYMVLRNDFAAFTQRCFQTVVPGQPFLDNWHLEAIAYHLERVRRGEIRRLIITLPPRSLKSIFASVAYPAFLLGHDPTRRIICVSYAQELSAKHARDCRLVIESPWFARVFPKTQIDPRKNTEAEFETTRHGYRMATSVGGTLTGRGGDTLLIDDPMKPSEAMSEARRKAVTEWYDATLASRLDQKTQGAIVLIMQRLHVDDLVGNLLRKGEPWVHLNLPAIAVIPQEIPISEGKVYRRRVGELLHPEREPQHILDELKVSMGSLQFSAQYQQAPVPPGGALIQWDWFQTYDQLPQRRPGDRIIQSWDTASKTDDRNDFSVCTTWLFRKETKEYYLLHVYRERLEYPDLRRKIIAHAEAHQAKTVLIEDAGSGMHLAQDLKRESKVRPIAIRPEGSKAMRMEAQSALIEAGHVLVPAAASWLGDFQLEMNAFPGGRHDDQVDSVSQFLEWASARQPKRIHIEFL